MRYLLFSLGLLVALATCPSPLPPGAWADTSSKPAAVAFDLLKTKHMVVQIKVNGKGPYRVIFDTGAPVMLLNTKIAKESGLLAKNAKAPLFSLFGSMAPVKIKMLEIGGLKAENVPVMVMDHPSIDLISKVLGPIEGIVGFPFFARYKMTIDYQAKEMTFVPNGFDPPDYLETITAALMAPPKPKFMAPTGQWGLRLGKDKADNQAGVNVISVLRESAAERAGIRTGDRLLTVDGRWTDSVVDTYLAAGHVKPGAEAKVLVRRGDQEIEILVKPRLGL
jgi:hypothetical protein